MPRRLEAVDNRFMSWRRRASVVAVAGVVTGVLGASALAGTVRPNAGDQALAKAAVLHLSDFTAAAGWVATMPPSGGGTSGAANASCASASSSTGLTETGQAESAFRAPGFFVQSWATVLQTSAMVQLDWRRSTPEILDCLRAAIRQSLKPGTKLTSVAELPFPKVAPLLRAYRATVSVTVQDKTIPMVADM